ncbi:MAG: hypothetical protein LBJ95_04660 [Oscillospiraceae bacterium]|nr:hypothetical protein [Oscillospiraceae bacterium]
MFSWSPARGGRRWTQGSGKAAMDYLRLMRSVNVPTYRYRSGQLDGPQTLEIGTGCPPDEADQCWTK